MDSIENINQIEYIRPLSNEGQRVEYFVSYEHCNGSLVHLIQRIKA